MKLLILGTIRAWSWIRVLVFAAAIACGAPAGAPSLLLPQPRTGETGIRRRSKLAGLPMMITPGRLTQMGTQSLTIRPAAASRQWSWQLRPRNDRHR